MRKFTASLVVAVMMMAAGSAYALTTTLTNGNSTVDINDGNVANWKINGIDNLWQQQLFYRVGETGGETALSGATLNGTIGTNIASINYAPAGITAAVYYTLNGGSAGSVDSSITQNFQITNTSGIAQVLHLFLYTDFDLGGQISNDRGTHTTNSITQINDTLNLQGQIAVSPTETKWQIGAYPGLLNLLKDSNPTTLTNTINNLTGDITSAFQWDVYLGAGGIFNFGMTSSITPAVPEPGTMMLFGIGMLGLAVYGKRRMGKKA